MGFDWLKFVSSWRYVGPRRRSAGLKIFPYGDLFSVMDCICAQEGLSCLILRPKMPLWWLLGCLRWLLVAQVGAMKDSWWLRQAWLRSNVALTGWICHLDFAAMFSDSPKLASSMRYQGGYATSISHRWLLIDWWWPPAGAKLGQAGA